jgi:hypothetical protein
MRYMYVVAGEEPVQSDLPPKAAEIEAVIDGLLEIYRYENGEFQELTPIDGEDADNWSIVERSV